MRSGLQAFIAGFIAPALLLIPLYAILLENGNIQALQKYPLYIIPFCWGVWDMLYYYIGRHVLLLKKIGVWGAILGLGLSFSGIYYFHTIELYKKCFPSGVFIYQALSVEAVLYFFLWESIVRYLNRILID
jgi:hypothetical protein